MSPILFSFIMQAFMDTTKLDTPSAEFRYFPEPKNKSVKGMNGRLVGQPTASIGTPFNFNNCFYVDDSVFLTEKLEDLKTIIPILMKQFERLGLQMHVGCGNMKSKTEAMFFPASLKEANKLRTEKSLPDDIQLPNDQFVQCTSQFKYLGSTITPELNEDMEIKIRINKAKSLMGVTKYFFNNKDVDRRTKHAVYTASPLNALLFGAETWNLSEKNKKYLESFHHGAIRRILGINWKQVREERIRNKQVRFRFCNIPKIETYIYRRTATYVGKVSRAPEDTLPKCFLGAWIKMPRKTGGPQLTCNNNFLKAINAILPEETLSSKQGLFKEWIPLAKEEAVWTDYIERYFESNKTMDDEREYYEDDESEKNEKESEHRP
jgi:hypothetical protein